VGCRDPTAEQRLEVEAPISWNPEGVAGNGGVGGVEQGRGQRHGGNGHGDVVRLQSGFSSGGVKCVARKESVLPPRSGSPGRERESGAGNTTNPMTGSGMQQARDLRAEETVEVVRNHEDGT
jgi:hypothetical protein